MKREFGRLAEGPFDVLVVGGGIYGAWTAYDAALRGLRVALVERTDWGAGTSSASSKLIHGGLRYLEHLWVVLVKKTLAERRRLAELGPHRVRPLSFVLPVYQGDRVGRFRLKVGLSVYDGLARGPQPVTPHRSLEPEEVLALCGFLSHEGLLGGFEYGDCVTDDARFTLEIVAGALAAGAVAVNHAEVTSLLFQGDRVIGASVLDREGGSTLELRAPVTINAAGPWLDGLLGADSGRRPLARLSKGVHLVLPRLPGNHALLLTARSDGRPVFLVPWYGRTLLGTTDTDYAGHPDDVRAEPEDIGYLLSEANRALVGVRWSEADILGLFAGLRSLQNVPERSSPTVSREWSLEEPHERLLVSVGGKYTSARADASEAVDRVMEILGRPKGFSSTASRPFPWRPPLPLEEWSRGERRNGERLGLDPETALAVTFRYGASIGALHDILRASPELAARIEPEVPFCLGEIVHGVRNEMARTLEDLLRRRIPIALLARCDEHTLGAAADVAASALGFSAERRDGELLSLLGRAGTSSGLTERFRP